MAATLGVLAAAAPASAATPPGDPRPPSAIDQYVEAIPTSSGPAPTGRSGTPRPLPREVVSQIRTEGGADAQALVEVATSPAYGAPPAETSRPTELPRAGEAFDAPTQPSPLDAVVTPIADADEPRLLLLLALLAAMTVASLALAVRRQVR